MRTLARLGDPVEGFALTASLNPVEGVTVELDLSGTIDVAAERARLSKDLAAAEKELAVNAGKLGNAEFVGKAPEAVIAKVRERLAARTMARSW